MVSRRLILRGAAGAAAVAPLALALDALADTTAQPSAPAAPKPGGQPVPETLARRRTSLASGASVAGTEFPLTHLAVSWSGAAAAVRLRTSTGWGPWREAHGCPGEPDKAPGGRAAADNTGGSAVVAAPGATGYEVRVAGGGTAQVLELNTVAGPARAVAAPTSPLRLPAGTQAPSLDLPVYLSRPCWGADESYRYNPDGTLIWPPEFFGVQTLTVHHSGFDDDAEPAATIRAIYYNQAVVNGWGDVGYQLFVDADGRVYEGLYSDPDPVPVFGPELGADGRPLMVNGAHVRAFNAGNIGVCLLGDFTARKPTRAAYRSLKHVLALLSAACRLDPLGTTNYVNPVNGNRAAIATICGHRDWNTANPVADPTLCPGDTFYPELPKLRRDVAKLLD